jgi:hypothetical protein
MGKASIFASGERRKESEVEQRPDQTAPKPYRCTRAKRYPFIGILPFHCRQGVEFDHTRPLSSWSLFGWKPRIGMEQGDLSHK